jgi:hypothetical protein
MFAVPATVALFDQRSTTAGPVRKEAGDIISWFLVWLLLTLLIGFRYQVGGDWGSYLRHFLEAKGMSFGDISSKSEFGYWSLNWIAAEFDWGIVGVNVIGGGIFALGLLKFCLRLPRPWLALTASVPYLVIVVAMGYTRQGIALGLAMIGLVGLLDGKTIKFVLLIALATTVHKSALLLLPISALANSRNRYWTATWVGLTGMVLYYLLLAKDVDRLYTNYVVAQYQSQGAFVRLAMNAIPAAILLSRRSRFPIPESEARLWRVLALLAIGMFAFFFVSQASTALDRMALYLLPLQLAIFSYLPDAVAARPERSETTPRKGCSAGRGIAQTTTAMTIMYFALVEFVWLNFAANAFYWIPYRIYLE